MIVFFGKGKVSEGIQKFAQAVNMSLTIMDDADRSDELLGEAEEIIATPGIPAGHKLYTQYGSKTVSELNFLGTWLQKQDWKENISLIGVTGTDGKSTVCHILYHCLKGVLTDRTVRLSGNFEEPLAETLSNIVTQ